jgi:hypothetical protein
MKKEWCNDSIRENPWRFRFFPSPARAQQQEMPRIARMITDVESGACARIAATNCTWRLAERADLVNCPD